MKWIIFVEGDPDREGVRVIELDADDYPTPIGIWLHLLEKGLCGDSMDEVKLDGIKGTRLRAFKAEEVPFPFLDAYVAERELQETHASDNRLRQAEEKMLKDLAEKLGYRIEKA